MNYEWDEMKRAKNILRHGVDFNSIHDFDWATALTLLDDRHNKITRSNDAYQVLHDNWGDQMGLVEELNILMLNRSNRVLAMCNISKGGISGTVVDLRVVFAMALKGCATSLVLAHNHPSGNLIPSQADIDITRKFRKAGELLDIPVVDHLIIAPHPKDGYYSFADDAAL